VDRVDVTAAGRGGAARSLAVHFQAPDGSTHTAQLTVGSSVGAVDVGGSVAVSYLATDPDDVRRAGGDGGASPVPVAVMAAAGIALLVVAGVAAWRLRSLARTLRHNPWVVAEARLVELALDGPAGRNVLRMLELRGAPDDGIVLAAPIAIRGQLIDHLVPQAWIAGSERRFVAAAPGGGRLLRMRRARMTGAEHAPVMPPLRSRLDGGD
jgi:hypothetical protein